MPLYLRWFGLAADRSAFYRSPAIRDAYRSWVEHLVTRRNQLTGRYYCDEPSVLAWELANEPRAEGRRDRNTLLEWIDQMSGFVKSLDPNHLVASGDEGFFCRGGSSHLYDGRYGVDFQAIIALSNIDFGTFHLYPSHWGEAENKDFVRHWIKDHVDAGARVDKPVLLEEFAVPVHDVSSYSCEAWTRQVRDEGGAGALVWMLGSEAPDAIQFRDRYTFFVDLCRRNSTAASA